MAELFTIVRTIGDLTDEITGLQMDSRKIETGDLFICVPGIDGFLEDRHLFAQDAIKNGAARYLSNASLRLIFPKSLLRTLVQLWPLLPPTFIAILLTK